MRRLLLVLIVIAGFNSRIPAQVVWESVGGEADGFVFDLLSNDEEGRLYACGAFDNIGGTPCAGLAYFDGRAWQALGEGTGRTAWGRTGVGYNFEKYGGELYVSGEFEEIEGNIGFGIHVAKWNGAGWISVGEFDGGVLVEEIGGHLLAFGSFDSINGQEAKHIARLEGESWIPLVDSVPFSPGDGENVMSLEVYKGSYYLGGNIFFGDESKGIVKWDGVNWMSVGNGIKGPYGWVSDMAEYKGILFVGGFFWKTFGNVADYVMAWDGEKWFDPFPGVTFTGQPSALELINGRLYIVCPHHHDDAVGTYSMAYYDGNYFCSFGNATEQTLGIHSWNGELYAFGDDLSQYPNRVRSVGKWLGGTSTDVCQFSPLPTEYLVSGGDNAVLYPNPPDQYFSLQLPDSATHSEIAVYDAAGREVIGLRSWDLGDEPVDVSHFAAGVYVVRVWVSGKVENVKLVVN